MSSLTSAVAAVITDPPAACCCASRARVTGCWGLPGGTDPPGREPDPRALRDIRAETGSETEVVDLVGLYQLTGAPAGGRRAAARRAGARLPGPRRRRRGRGQLAGRICRLVLARRPTRCPSRSTADHPGRRRRRDRRPVRRAARRRTATPSPRSPRRRPDAAGDARRPPVSRRTARGATTRSRRGTDADAGAAPGPRAAVSVRSDAVGQVGAERAQRGQARGLVRGVEQAADQRAADDHPVGVRADLGRLRAVADAEARRRPAGRSTARTRATRVGAALRGLRPGRR